MQTEVIDGCYTLAGSVVEVPESHQVERLHKDLAISAKAQVRHVLDVVPQPFTELGRVSTPHLGQSGDAGPHVMSAVLLWRVTVEVFHEERPRTHQTHFAAQNVQQLGKLIQACLPQPTAYGRQPFGVRK